MKWPTWTEVTLLIGAIAAVIAAIKGHSNGEKIAQVRIELNGRMTQLIEASKAQGRQDERDASGASEK
jgi:hypothetical protein